MAETFKDLENVDKAYTFLSSLCKGFAIGISPAEYM